MARRIGLKDIHLAIVKKNDYKSYEADVPIKLFKAIKGKISVKRTSEKVYSDDSIEDILSALDSIDVELEGDGLKLAIKAAISGSKYIKGMLIENKDDESVEIALGFRAKNSKGKYEFVWFYCGKFDGDDEDEFETQGDKIATQSKSLKGTFYARAMDGVYRIRVNEDELVQENTEVIEILKTWFKEVPEVLSEDTEAEQLKQESSEENIIIDTKKDNLK